MIHLKIVICIGICFLGIIKYTQGVDEYTDENRPYEFGFTIDGEQHRHEKKDKNGIIMGEFGFITADGVYHVTVYATDENGRFKILSMKNIRVKPYPTAGSVKKGHSLPFPPSKSAPEIQGPQTPDEIKPNKLLSTLPAKSCSHCSIPTTTTTTKAPQLSDIAIVATNPKIPSRPGLTASQLGLTPQSNPQYPQSYPQQSDSGIIESQNTGLNIPQAGSRLGQNSPQNSGVSDSIERSRINQNNPQNLRENQEVRDRKKYSPQQNNINRNNGQSEIVTNSQYPQQGYSSIQNKPQQQSSTNEYNPQNMNTRTEINNYSQQEIAYPNDYPHQQSDVYQNNYPQKDRSKDEYYPQQVSGVQSESPRTTDFDQHRPEVAISTQQSPNLQDSNSRVPKQYNDITGTNQPQGFENVIANKPTLIAAQMQIVPKETDIHHREPGEQEGLPDGVSKDDVAHLLYTFNYTVGFHGHHEEGYSNGAKQGYYYVTGRNGIRTRVDYVADEKGFRPRISQIALDLLSDDVPKPETEKDEKFGLKGYEFKWLYYPADEKPQ